MALDTLADDIASLAEYRKALDACSRNQTYSITAGEGSRTLTRADLKDIRETITWLEGRILDAQQRARGRSRVNYVS